MKVITPDTPSLVTDQTVVEPLVLVTTLVLGAIVMIVPRRRAVVPFLALAFFLPVAQRVVIAEIDFNMLRVLLLFGWARMFARGDFRGVKWGGVDYAMFAWVTISSVVYVLGRGEIDAAIFRAGQTYDVLGLYVVLRCWLRDFPSLQTTVVASCVCAAVLALVMSVEFSTGRNFFSVFGGVDAVTKIRDGRLRCQAAFSHPILAGSAGAALAPLCLWLIVRGGKHRLYGVIGWISSAAIVVFSSSSGPLLGWLAGMGACSLWFLRQHMRLIRWGVAGFALALHIVANRPIWHWIGAMNVVGASASYHRVRLINGAIDHFSEWALLGTLSTAHWGFGLNDVTSQYILEGVRGGIWSLIAFLVLLGLAFRCVGVALRLLRSEDRLRGARRVPMLLCWALGAMLFVHTINFIGVSYFGQMQVFLVLSIAMIAGARDAAERAVAQAEPGPASATHANRVRALLRPTAPTGHGALSLDPRGS